MSWGFGFRPYVSVAKKKAQGKAFAAKLAKKEKRALAPIEVKGRTIAESFWGVAWCDNLERYSDFENRLPRGRTYVRNGSVVDLQIERGKVKAIVCGSETYQVKITIDTVSNSVWSKIKKDCSNSVDSLIDLLQGRFDQGVMERLSQKNGGLFPQPKEIKMSCSCPDYAGMCKHVAATLYGVGVRLDAEPELLFTLRDVDHLELLGEAVEGNNLSQALQGKNENALNGSDLGDIFGIDLEGPNSTEAPKTRSKPKAAKKPKAALKKASPKKSAGRPKTKAKTTARVS